MDSGVLSGWRFHFGAGDRAGGYLFSFLYACDTEHSEEWDGTYRRASVFLVLSLTGARTGTRQGCCFDKNGANRLVF